MWPPLVSYKKEEMCPLRISEQKVEIVFLGEKEEMIVDKCGVAGFKFKNNNVFPYLYYSLRALQHRGQESAGMAIYSDGSIKEHRAMGLVSEVFENIYIEGNVGIGHVRYSTQGSSSIKNAQPLVMFTKIGIMAVSHNGEIANAHELREKLMAEGHTFVTESDSEIIAKVISIETSKTGDFVLGIKRAMRILRGSYSLAILINDRLFGIRDPLGIRPLALGKVDFGYGIASESVAFDSLDGEFIRDVLPGEIVEVKEDGFITHARIKKKHYAHCMFEYVYFARADSIIDGKSVYEVRKNLGRILAEEQPVDGDVVVPVPDSGRAHALGYSEKSGIPFAEGIMKNRYVERTFIMPYQEHRVAGIKLKLNPVKSVVSGKRIILVDDSIVRGNTMLKIVNMLRKAGAKEVHVRIGSPPIIAPCYLGIDMKTRDQFIATDRTWEEIARAINADSVGYLSIEGLVKAIGHARENLCLGCLTGEYPVRIKGEKFREVKQIEDY